MYCVGENSQVLSVGSLSCHNATFHARKGPRTCSRVKTRSRQGILVILTDMYRVEPVLTPA